MITERNYLDVYHYEKWSDKEIPVYNKGDVFQPNSIQVTKLQLAIAQLRINKVLLCGFKAQRRHDRSSPAVDWSRFDRSNGKTWHR